METSALLTMSTLRGFRAGAVCAVYANRAHDTFIHHDDKPFAEARCVEVALRGLDRLAQLAELRGDRACWHPGLALK
jgi:uridine phosphorylase